jgi:hypothetical protein
MIRNAKVERWKDLSDGMGRWRIELKLLAVALFVGVLMGQAAAQTEIARPDSAGGPTRVQVSIGVLDLTEIKATSQSKSADVFMLAAWHDPRLVHPGPGVITKSLDDVWHPQLQLTGRRKVSPLLPRVVEISPDGEVVYRQRIWGETSQRLELREFPFDEQTLEFRLLAMGYSPAEIEFTSHEKYPTGMATDISLSDWEVLSSAVDIAPYQPMEHVKPLASYGFRIEVDRRSNIIVSNMIVPLLFIVMMSWAVFWLDPDLAGVQVSVATTSMLTLIAYRFMIASELPRIPYMTRLDVFVFVATTLVFLTFVQALSTACLAKSDRLDLARRIDLKARWVMPLLFVALFGISFFA